MVTRSGSGVLCKSWGEAKEDVGNVEGVLSLIGKGVQDIRGRRQKKYPFKLDGTQRRKQVYGEGLVEKELLNKQSLLLRDGAVIQGVKFLANAAGLGSRKKGNIISDLFGIDAKGSPVLGEVKVTDRDPWYAVVECAAQVALVRADRKNLTSWIGEELKMKARYVGAWGMVIAPEAYWRKQQTALAEKLLDELKRVTKIRICCVSYPELKQLRVDPVRLNVVFGMPPSTKRVLQSSELKPGTCGNGT